MKFRLHNTYNYADLQCRFIAAFHWKRPDIFRTVLENMLVGDKYSRKGRYYPLTQTDEFFKKVEPLTDLSHFETVLKELFSLQKNDKLFVEKSYYLIDEIVHFYKREGEEVIREFIEKNPQYLEDLNTKYTFNTFNKTHQNSDVEMKNFEERLPVTIEYVGKYRSRCHDMHKQFKQIRSKKKRILKKTASKFLRY